MAFQNGSASRCLWLISYAHDNPRAITHDSPESKISAKPAKTALEGSQKFCRKKHDCLPVFFFNNKVHYPKIDNLEINPILLN